MEYRKEKRSTGAFDEKKTFRVIPGMLVAGRYEIKCVLGMGRITTVYLARDLSLDLDVAIKLIPRELTEKPVAVTVLRMAAASAMELSHKHIAQLYSLEIWNDFYFAAVEHLPCGNLTSFMGENRGQVPLCEVIPILEQAARAIDYAHTNSKPMIHLALKPSNILIAKDGRVKITDFVLARTINDLSIRTWGMDYFVPTVFTSPEQLTNGEAGAWSDIYSFSAIAYELLSGKPPFSGNGFASDIEKADIPKIQNLPEHVNQVLMAGMNRDINKRPISAGEFVSMLAGRKKPPLILNTEERGKDGIRDYKNHAPRRRGTKNIVSSIAARANILFLILALTLILGLSWYGYYGSKVDASYKVDQKLFALETKPGDQIPMEVPSKEEIFPSQKPKPKPKPKPSKQVLYGSLSLDSNPAKAIVYLDDVIKGVTPLVLSRETAGRHILSIKKDGYKEWKKEVSVASKVRKSIKADLSAVFGRLRLTSKPDGAVVFLDGTKAGITPLAMERVTKGLRRISIKSNGYHTWEKKVNIKSGELMALNADLDKLSGSISIKTDPAGAVVYIAGKKRGLSPFTAKGLNPGLINIKIEKECFIPVIRDLKLKPGILSKLKFTLKKKCVDLAVTSEPSGADWYIDGRLIGQTPKTIEHISSGIHTIKMRRQKYLDREILVNLNPGKKESVHLVLKPKLPDQGDIFIEPKTGMVFIWMEGGCYKMGSPLDEIGRDDDEGPVHKVCLGGAWIGKYEVTQGEWTKVMGTNPSFFSKGDNYPVDNVSWKDVSAFIEKLNGINDVKDLYRLPTEDEWEYACRAGGEESQKFSGGDHVGGFSWYKKNSSRTTHPGGEKKPNNFGLFDMSGNLSEWTSDKYDSRAYDKHEGFGMGKTMHPTSFVIRGGSWRSSEKECRCADRKFSAYDKGSYEIGFRLVRNFP